jgi:hypothetical protein
VSSIAKRVTGSVLTGFVLAAALAGCGGSSAPAAPAETCAQGSRLLPSSSSAEGVTGCAPDAVVEAVNRDPRFARVFAACHEASNGLLAGVSRVNPNPSLLHSELGSLAYEGLRIDEETLAKLRSVNVASADAGLLQALTEHLSTNITTLLAVQKELQSKSGGPDDASKLHRLLLAYGGCESVSLAKPR